MLPPISTIETDKYVLKVLWCADAETMYPLTSKPYLGKIARSHKINLVRNTALELVQPFFGTGRNLTCDNFFTDMELTKQLTAAKMTVVGTLRRNKNFIPPEFQIPKAPRKESQSLLIRKTMLVSYKSGAKKCNSPVIHPQRWEYGPEEISEHGP